MTFSASRDGGSNRTAVAYEQPAFAALIAINSWRTNIRLCPLLSSVTALRISTVRRFAECFERYCRAMVHPARIPRKRMRP
jgi:hypothetical protein